MNLRPIELNFDAVMHFFGALKALKAFVLIVISTYAYFF